MSKESLYPSHNGLKRKAKGCVQIMVSGNWLNKLDDEFTAMQSRLTQLEEAAREMAEALRFYAKHCYQHSLEADNGQPTAIVAKTALQKYKLIKDGEIK